MTDRRYIVVKQIQAKELERGDLFRHEYHTKGTWQVVESNTTDCNGRHVAMQFHPWDANIADRELVQIQVEEPAPTKVSQRIDDTWRRTALGYLRAIPASALWPDEVALIQRYEEQGFEVAKGGFAQP